MDDPGVRRDPLTPAERTWLQSNLAWLAEQGVDVGGAASLGNCYDRLWAAWAAQPDDARDDPNVLINAVGVGLGEHLRRSLGLAWMTVTDEYGTDLALFGDAGKVTLFPPNAVAKRWADGQTGWIPGFVEAVRQSVADVRAGGTGV